MAELHRQLAEYYSHPPSSYYVIADRPALYYTPAIQPFHCDIVGRVRSGSSLLEMGCGSAHLCPFVEAAGGSYTGVDHSRELLEANRERFPHAQFFPIGTPLSRRFDIVASLYTIEHVVDPAAYLQGMWQACKPGGMMAIICPDFVDGAGLPPSFYYGKTSRRFRDKLRSFALADAFQHLLDLFWRASRWKAQARSVPPGAFWINVRPRIFDGAAYSIDADAVHLPRLTDIVWWLETQGASIVVTSRSLPNVDPSILKNNCYVLARKPVA